ncbi:thioredoxin family protein [Tuwongella immobilis]|uniref:Thioredoxin domain-containing protein n=1 Tax=Tuwongella immobilis TaxID=692036 RepID=A0A6C2YR83_9BACT|nr:thioredoxin family protein [Tuwongella immobilis]VIP04158.1 alkyl hydroperoxide reductase : Uncharacterized protein OS=Planctomyces maris DSM 8797 GN=PM8797T_11409 PE=4 SV=1: Redoxin [Tuwongella immobilis]VTS05681.1 alkyl hydroperoxide reductase : Uncharacterized protein OS=Planctomyces maris DSM 8797 GN=PM8797T_11409 PE=4 SV=1: Redoxin [Tuwongella immobilis]
MFRCLASLSLVLLSSHLWAGEFNPTLKIGDSAPGWSKLPGTDGNTHSMADLADKKVIVVVFTCNSCPTAVDYEQRIVAIARKYAADPQSPVAVVAINSNTIAADRMDKMIDRAKERGFPFAYLHDESQKVAKAFGAQYTPEAFVLDADRKVVYMGAIDDKTKAEEAKISYVAQAIEAALAGKAPEKVETLPRGCRIRFNKARRDDD